jgi:hypothetical protein
VLSIAHRSAVRAFRPIAAAFVSNPVLPAGLKPVDRHALPKPQQSHHFNSHDRAAGSDSSTLLLTSSGRPRPLPTEDHHLVPQHPLFTRGQGPCAALCFVCDPSSSHRRSPITAFTTALAPRFIPQHPTLQLLETCTVTVVVLQSTTGLHKHTQ